MNFPCYHLVLDFRFMFTKNVSSHKGIAWPRSRACFLFPHVHSKMRKIFCGKNIRKKLRMLTLFIDHTQHEDIFKNTRKNIGKSALWFELFMTLNESENVQNCLSRYGSVELFVDSVMVLREVDMKLLTDKFHEQP